VYRLSLVREANQVAEHEFDAGDDLKKISGCGSRKRNLATIHICNFDSHRLLTKRALPGATFHQRKVGVSNEELDRREDGEDSREVIEHEHIHGLRLFPVEE
jgi:hypothetical protein